MPAHANKNLRNINPAFTGKAVEKTKKLSGTAGKSAADTQQNMVGTEFSPGSREFSGPFGGENQSK